MRTSELPSELSERGIWWQVAGFTIVGCVSIAVLEEFAGSDIRAFQYFETAVTRLYWAFVIPLAGLFDGGRKLFEKRSEIRRAVREKIREEGRQEGRRQEVQRVRKVLRSIVVQDDSTGSRTFNVTPEELETLLNGDVDDATHRDDG
jgi:hypothetical protein